MKQATINRVSLRGYVFSFNLQERESNSERSKGAKYISGNLNIATDDEGLNVVPVSFFVMEMTKKGTVNSTFSTLKQIMTDNNTFEVEGTNAARVRVDGSIDVNDFYGRDGNLVSGKRVRGSFIHFLNANESIGNNPAYFEADALIQNVTERESQDGSSYVDLKGFVFNYRNDALPVTLQSMSEQGMNFFLDQDITPSNPYFGKVWGNITSTIVTIEQEADDSNVGFGQAVVQPTTRSFRNWNVVGANVNIGYGDDTITPEELDTKVKERETRLAELKARTDQNNNSPTGQAGFPTTAPAAKAKPSAAAIEDDYKF